MTVALFYCRLCCLSLLAMLMSSVGHGAESSMLLRRDHDSTTMKVEIGAWGKMDFHWSATVDDGLLTWELDSQKIGDHEAAIVTDEDGVLCVTMHFPQPQVELMHRVAREKGNRFRQQIGIRNCGKKPIRWLEAMPFQGQCFIEATQTWLTGQHPRTSMVSDLPLNQALAIHEYGSWYDARGGGMVFGPAGEPVSYVAYEWLRKQSQTYEVTARVPMDRIVIEPGETRWAQEVIWIYDRPQAAWKQWAEGIQSSHGARLTKPAVHGWNNWNQLEKKEIDVELREIIQTIQQSENRLSPAVIQMDYNYDDPILSKRLASSWLPVIQAEAQALGARMGANIGVAGHSWPGARDARELAERIAAGAKQGINYFKVYYPPDRVRADDKRTAFQVYRDDWKAIRQAAGEEVYLLYCNYEPDRAAVGFVDASRVGPDADRRRIRPAMDQALRSFVLHDRWFSIDLDTYFTGTDIANISQIEGSWPLVRTWLSMVGLSCGSAITSDPWYWSDFHPYWRNVEILSPPAKERTDVMDVGRQKEWPRLMSHVTRPWGEAYVALLWNPKEKENTVTLDFAESGMDMGQRYAVWSFWDDRYLGVAEKSWTTPRLGPSASQHLLLTPLPKDPIAPVLIGSNLHIFCGASEVKQFVSKRARCSISLTDAGAREGDLFLYSRQQPVLARAIGCTVSGITSAGENVWRVSLHERQRGREQSIDLTLPLPIHLQPWFWFVMGLLVFSLAFSLWNYRKRIRFERARLLDQERARIARDIHDDLGASLTHIALLGELAQSEIDHPDRARTHVDDIFRAARKLTRSVDEIVWALNPANDTLDHFAAYVGDFTQDFLHSAHLDCRLEIPSDLPKGTLSPQVRHELFLIIKEILHNIVTHAKARKVVFVMKHTEHCLMICIHDDGCGFDPSSTTPSRPGGGHGLANIRERVKAIDGELDIDSAIGQGCRVTIRLDFSSYHF